MSATLTVGGIACTMIEDTLDLTNSADERQRFQCDLIDYSNTHFVKGDLVVLTDPILGVMFTGSLNSDKEVPQYPSGYIVHSIDCTDFGQAVAGNRTYTATYATPATAGKIVVDQLTNVLAAEGIVSGYAQQTDITTSDWSQGIASGTIATADVGNGDLELAPAGSDLTITESTTAQFATGTLTNVQASNNTLIPTSTTALSCTATLLGTLAGSFMAVKFWGGSMTVGTSDTLNYDIWIAGTSPQDTVGVDLYFSDGTKMSGSTILDQNNLSGAPTTDLSAYAVNTWYTRNIALGSGLNGKTINSVTITVAGTSTGTYTAYIKNVYLGSQTGNKFFAVGATTTNVSPPQIAQYAGYQVSAVFSSVVNVFLATNATRVSTAYSIDAVKLLSSSLITWSALPTAGVSVSASYDGGASYVPCTNNAALPALPSGTNVAGMTLTLMETLNAGGSTDPTVFPVLDNLSIMLESAPAATKSDIVQSYITSTNWNTGTYTNTVLSGNNLTLGSITRNWNDNLITNQTLFAPSGVTQSASGSVYTMTTGTTLGTNNFGQSRLDFAEQLVDFILDVDMSVNSSINGLSAFVGFTYRQTSWQATTNNTYAYLVQFYPTQGSNSGYISLAYGSNSTNDAVTTIQNVNQSISTSTFYHVKVIVKGTRHQIYWNNATSPTIDVIDSTYQQIGSFGLRQYNFAYQTGSQTAGVTKWDNLVIQPLQTGTWQSSAVSISGLTTCGLSSIYWTETGTGNQALANILVQTSIDSGSTFQNCTNGGAIPNLTSGMTVTGKSIITLVTINSISVSYLPVLSQMVWRVLGAYPGSSGTRSTVPLGNDMTISRTSASSWLSALDGQPWTKVGTGTIAVGSGVETIANTTGDIHMILGSRTWTDEDGTCRFSLSASTISAGIELHYIDANNFYRLQVSTTTVSLVKKVSGVTTTLASVSMAVSTSVLYRMRFRIVGSGPITLYGNVWADQTLEPTINPTTYQWNNSAWTVSAVD